jgi:hypothetical protein
MAAPGSDVAYVFGYASLVALRETLPVGEIEHAAIPGRLLGFRRYWGVAMNNWEGGDSVKHFLDRETGERHRIRVAYLDVREEDGSTVNGLALPVDEPRLAEHDAREINYERVGVTAAFEPSTSTDALPTGVEVFAYVGLEEARERCRRGLAEGDAVVSRDYVASVHRAFEGLAPRALAEFDRSTDPLPFPERDLRVVLPR